MGGARPVFLKQGGTDDMAQTESTVAATAPTVTLTQEQLNQLLKAAAGGSNAGMTAEDLAKAFAKAQRPENTQAPMASVYNPRGETVTPRPDFVARKVSQNGMRLDKDTLTWEEIEAINALPPGEFWVTKADNSRAKFTVRITRGADETTVEALDFHFPCKDELREGHRSLFEYFLEVLDQSGNEAKAELLRALRKTLNKERAAMHAA